MGNFCKTGAILSIFLIVSGCAHTQLEVWERGNISKKAMSWEPDALEASLNNHIYFSKEAASGGGAAAGGGCGCN